MTDIAGISREEALDALEWGARTLVEGALRKVSAGEPRTSGEEKTGGERQAG
jgi:hypothetical protein